MRKNKHGLEIVEQENHFKVGDEWVCKWDANHDWWEVEGKTIQEVVVMLTTIVSNNSGKQIVMGANDSLEIIIRTPKSPEQISQEIDAVLPKTEAAKQRRKELYLLALKQAEQHKQEAEQEGWKL